MRIPSQRVCLGRTSLPVNLACTGRLDQAEGLARRNPNTRLAIDHLGLPQPHEPPAPARPFADLPKLLALAPQANVAVKISGACTLSHQPFPYQDIWDPLGRIFDALALIAACGAPTGPARSAC